MPLWSCCAAASKGAEQMQYPKKKPETAVLLLLLGLVVLAGIALAVLTASKPNRLPVKPPTAASRCWPSRRIQFGRSKWKRGAEP